MNQPTSLRLVGTRPEAGNVTTFIFDPAGLTWTAGQYQTYRLPHEGEATHDNEHWFTISSAPSEGTINISTRLTGSPFKAALSALKPGDTLGRSDIEGDFTWQDSSPVVLVAAGIGITPYRSMLLERAHVRLPMEATLLYFTRDDQIPFKQELDNLADRFPDLRIHYIIGEPVSANKIMTLAPESRERTVYLSGPEPMVISLSEQLDHQGVRTKRDEFPGYGEQDY